MDLPDWDRLRFKMVDEQLQARGIRDARVLEAMRSVPRHLFVPEEIRKHAYEDRALAIGLGQTISQPFMIGIMLQALNFKGKEKVLEIGTGTGYQAALLGHLAQQVDTLEIIPELASEANHVLGKLSIPNVYSHLGDGSHGLPREAPFDVIIVAAGAPDTPPELTEQLAEGGKLLIPLGDQKQQMLTLLEKKEGTITRSPLGPCAFVPFRGTRGWPAI